MSGCLDYRKDLGRSAAYRFMLADPCVYRETLHFAIEHAPEKNNIATDYVAVTYLYADRPPEGAGALPPAADRAVTDPKRIVIAAGWNVPIRAFSLQNATLKKGGQRIGRRDVRALSVRAEGGDIFGAHFIEVLCDVPSDGSYHLAAEVVAGPGVGPVQWTRDEAPIGPKVDLHASEPTIRTVPLGRAILRQGQNPLLLKLTPGGADGKAIGLDLITLVLERQ
jgi:hypothetical protein